MKDLVSVEENSQGSPNLSKVFQPSRRELLIGGLAVMAAETFPSKAFAAGSAFAQPNRQQKRKQGETSMSTVTAKDGTKINYKDWGTGEPIVFSHGWPLNSDAWDNQMLFFGLRGYRVIAHDRRGHGQSGGTWDHNDMDTYADDLAAVIDALDLKGATLIGHSTGGGEVARYIGRHGNERVKKAALVSAVPPIMVKSDQNPGGLEMSVFDGIRKGVAENRAQFFIDLSLPFYGYNRPGATVSEGIRQSFWLAGMVGQVKGMYDCIKAFSETDFTEDLKKIKVPTLILHGDDDQIVPYPDSGLLSSKIVKGATLKVLPGYGHGMCQTHPDEVNAELLQFLKA